MISASNYHGFSEQWKALLKAGLQEDAWQWDWTSLATTTRGKKGSQRLQAKVIAKSEGVWAATSLVLALNDLAREMGQTKDLVTSSFRDGDRFKVGDILVKWSGPSNLVLALERPFLNLASYVSGIATSTHALVQEVKRACPQQTPRVTSTRKTLPGYRDIGVLGVFAGGGMSHRVSLSGGVLIKENHVAAAGGVVAAIESARAVAPHGLKIEVEVRSMAELKQALKAKADVVMLDNFSPSQVKEALKQVSSLDHQVILEVSGGLNLSNISNYALPGVSILSVGSLTHSVKSCDLSLIVEGVKKL
jgi:nicotinate-nucleotide pyrophosphorylase (carboxylating)